MCVKGSGATEAPRQNTDRIVTGTTLDTHYGGTGPPEPVPSMCFDWVVRQACRTSRNLICPGSVVGSCLHSVRSPALVVVCCFLLLLCLCALTLHRLAKTRVDKVTIPPGWFPDLCIWSCVCKTSATDLLGFVFAQTSPPHPRSVARVALLAA
jgi:hypothetical protein